MSHKATAFHQDALQTGNNWDHILRKLVESHAMEPVFENHVTELPMLLAGSSWSAVQQLFDAARKLMKTQPYGKEPSQCHFHRTFGWARQDSITPRDVLSPTAYAVPRFVIELMSGVALRYVTQAIAVPDGGHAQEWQKMRALLLDLCQVWAQLLQLRYPKSDSTPEAAVNQLTVLESTHPWPTVAKQQAFLRDGIIEMDP